MQNNLFDNAQILCQYCSKECKNLNSLRQHEMRCAHNPDRKYAVCAGFNNKGKKAWNKGLTKETNQSLKLHGESVSKTLKGRAGRKHSEEEKQKISIARKHYLSEHPDKVPYLLNHSSKESFPETYFKKIFVSENILLNYHYQINKYELDFFNLQQKIDVEIDGEQHYLDKRIMKSDEDRDQYLKNLGWKIYRIRWSEYKKLTLSDKSKIINEIKSLWGINSVGRVTDF